MADQNVWHEGNSPLGVLLVNLGTPAAPNKASVGQFLREFLWDRRVVDLPRALWWPFLNGFIVPFRGAQLVQQYQKIWLEEGSPLMVYSRRQLEGLKQLLRQESNHQIEVELGMTYGQPSIQSGLNRLKEKGIRKLVILPLYPQYSATTTAAVFDAVWRELSSWRWIPELRMINHYADDDGYIGALVSSVQRHWAEHPRGDCLVLSFHGLPARSLPEGDPYYCFCQKTARLVAQGLDLKDDQWRLVFQSRFGREKWLEPYCDQTLRALPTEGKRRVDILCPGFAADCLETLEEMAIRNRAIFMEAGGEAYHYIPALNDDSLHLEALARLIRSSC
jgi:ferrochelatase